MSYNVLSVLLRSLAVKRQWNSGTSMAGAHIASLCGVFTLHIIMA
jgi:hypothetical protein